MSTQPRSQPNYPLFIILLVALLAVVYAFASNHLQMGISGSFTYMIYVFLGLVSSVVCYGFLSSMGEIKGYKYETTIKLGGAIVGLVVVGGGGMIYEKYVQRSDTVDVRLVFYRSKLSHTQKITGEATLLIGNKEFTVTLRSQSSVLLQGIPFAAEGTKMNLSLDCPDFEIDSSGYAGLTVDPAAPVYVKLVPRKLYASPEEAELSLTFNNGSAAVYVRRPNDKNVIIQLNAISSSSLIIPIAKEADLQVITNSGTPIFKTTLSSDQITFLTDKNLKEIYFEGFVPKELYDIAKGKTAFITIHYYDMSTKHLQKTWEATFDFNLHD